MSVETQQQCETAGFCAAPTLASNTYLQDTRDFYAVHADSCNILMADGSVKSFRDQNGDKFLNPGFGVSDISGQTPTIDATGYTDNTVELTPDQYFAGVFIDDTMRKGQFE